MKQEIASSEVLLESSNLGYFPVNSNGERVVCDGTSCIKGTLEETTTFLIDSLFRTLNDNSKNSKANAIRFKI
jgi:hypothetical protein